MSFSRNLFSNRYLLGVVCVAALTLLSAWVTAPGPQASRTASVEATLAVTAATR